MTAPTADTLLVASESRITRRVVEMTFADQPVQVAAVATGEEALRAWHADPVSVLIADIAMEAPNGYAIAHEVRTHQEGRRTAVILLASQTEVVDEVAVSRSRVSTVLRKPLDSHQLIDAVRDAVRMGPPAPRAAVAQVAAAEPAVAPVPAEPAAVLPDVADAMPMASLAAVVAEPQPLEAPPDEAASAVEDLPEAVNASAAAPVIAAIPVAEARRRGPTIDEARAEAEDVALLLGRDSSGLDDPPLMAVPPSVLSLTTGRRLADTFQAMLEVEQGAAPAVPMAPPAAEPVAATADFDAVAARIVADWNGDGVRLARLEREIVDRASHEARTAIGASVAENVPAMTAAIVEQVVRELVPRLAEELTRRLVADAADRLVREEIARLRATRAE